MIFRSTLFLTLLSISTAFAQSAYYNSTQGQGETASEAEVVKALSKYVYELKKPYMVFHWFNATGRNPHWMGPLSAYDYAGYNYVQNQGVRFFQNYCPQQSSSSSPGDCGYLTNTQYGTANVYGPGLYTAVDPAMTATFGGGAQKAVLVQIQLPKGYRVVDTKMINQLLTTEVRNYFQKEQCPYLNTMDGLLRIGSSYNSSTVEKCKLLVRHLLKDQLQMDGFFYAYGSTPFQGCNGSSPLSHSAETDAIGGYLGPFNQRAFIVTNPGKIPPANIRVFNMQTTDAKAERINLASVFKLTGTGFGFGGSYGSAAWSDLGPSDSNPNILNWLKENVIGCKAEVPYGPAK